MWPARCERRSVCQSTWTADLVSLTRYRSSSQRRPSIRRHSRARPAGAVAKGCRCWLNSSQRNCCALRVGSSAADCPCWLYAVCSVQDGCGAEPQQRAGRRTSGTTCDITVDGPAEVQLLSGVAAEDLARGGSRSATMMDPMLLKPLLWYVPVRPSRRRSSERNQRIGCFIYVSYLYKMLDCCPYNYSSDRIATSI